jgi:hypothetical protein
MKIEDVINWDSNNIHNSIEHWRNVERGGKEPNFLNARTLE